MSATGRFEAPQSRLGQMPWQAMLLTAVLVLMLLGGLGALATASLALVNPNIGDNQPPPALFAPGSWVWPWLVGTSGAMQVVGAANGFRRTRFLLVLVAAATPLVIAGIQTLAVGSTWPYLAVDAAMAGAVLVCRDEFGPGRQKGRTLVESGAEAAGLAAGRRGRGNELPLWLVAGFAGGVIPLVPVVTGAVAWVFFPPLGIALVAGLAFATWRIRGGTDRRTVRFWAAAAWAVAIGPYYAAVLSVVSPAGAAMPEGPALVWAIAWSTLLLAGGSAVLAGLTFDIGRRFLLRRRTVVE